MKSRKIPRFDSVREMAEFWDTHSLADFEGDLVEVEGPIAEPGDKSVLTVSLKPRQAQAVKRIAKAKGVRCKPLLQRWIAERIRQEAGGGQRS